MPRIASFGLLAILAGCSTAPRSQPPSAMSATGAGGLGPGTEAGETKSSRTAAVTSGSEQGLLSGTVLGRDGAPVVGATVGVAPRIGAWDVRRDALAATVRTGPDGRFQTGPLTPGQYGVAVALADGTLSFGESVQVRAGEPVLAVELRVGETPVTVRGTVVDEAGQPLKGAALRVVRPIVPFDDVADLPPLPDGRFQVSVPEGEYNVVASAPGFTPRMMRTSPPEPTEVRLERTPTEDERRAAVAWAREAAIPLQTVEAGHGFEDLRRLTPVLKDARVVALGEATHGTREFFQLKHRMFEFLVSELGFTVFAIEANFSESRALNDFVLTGKGDPSEGLKGLNVFPWQTEEVLELVRWMRRYNEDPAHRRKLKFYGVDMQSPIQAAANVDAYLRQVDATYAKQVGEPLTLMTGKDVWRLEKERLAAVGETLKEVARRFDSRRGEYTRRSSREAWALARQDLTVLSQCVAKMLDLHDYDFRDRSMAENLRWVLEFEGPGAKAVFWAHNGHVARGPGEWTANPAGRWLARSFGKGLYVFGFAFNQGSFQAMRMPTADAPAPRGVDEFTVPPAPEDSLDAALASTGLPLLALDLRAVPASGPVREWWRRALRTRDPGALYSHEGYPLSTSRNLELYDGLLFVERTTRARPLPWIIQVPKREQTAAPAQ
nr:erythromycin esterase family protein [Pyxidicoccus fallax]